MKHYREGAKMRRILAAALVSLAAGASFGQMMGAPVGTANYFPMVDGARFDYMHAGGPWATSSMVMRAGQSWAGRDGLYAMHYTYMCNAGVACSTDATDFFGMDRDGVHYYGGTGADPAGAHFSMMSLTNPEWVLMGTVYPGTMMSNGLYANAGSWTTAVNGTGNMMGSQGYMSSYFAQALETVTVPAGTFANVLHIREQRGSGVTRDVWYAAGVGMVMMSEGAQVAKLSGYTIPGSPAAPAGSPAALPFTPFMGLWWNPDESGTGYNLQVQHGTLVMTMFSYGATGEPVWYYAPGRLAAAGTGVTVTGTLDRYRGGQCASCAYVKPVAAGSDGTFSITFDTPSSATVQLPGGRTARIQPQPW